MGGGGGGVYYARLVFGEAGILNSKKPLTVPPAFLFSSLEGS